MNRNQESIEQLKRLTQAAKNFYGNNYSPGFISHKNDVRHYLGEEYIPYDWGDDIDSPANDEYKNVYMNKNPNYDFSQKPQTQNLMQTPKLVQQTTQFKTPKPQTQTMKSKPQSSGLMPKQKLKGFGDYLADYQEVVNKIGDEVVRYLPTSRIGDTVGTLHAVKQNMDANNLINGDNYYHRLGMCLNGQKGVDTALYSFAGGLVKEGYDFARKNYNDYKNNKLSLENFKNHVKASVKDVKNNYEGLIYGLTNPEKNCISWLKDLDINTNEWRNK